MLEPSPLCSSISFSKSDFLSQEPLRSFDLSQAAGSVKLEQSFNFFYFPIRMNNGLELLLLTYSESESRLWAEKLNECIASVEGRKY